jgi:hypothetical protein
MGNKGCRAKSIASRPNFEIQNQQFEILEEEGTGYG